MDSSSKGAALVTGASQGVGKTIKLRLAQDRHAVAVNNIPSKADAPVEQISSNDQGRALAITVDARSEEDAKAMIDRRVAELGGLTVVRRPPGTSRDNDTGSSWRTRAYVHRRIF
jgi:NAD(P)-dependent dehydrogenase (short-subunit alcohol dehydrogenase family)